MCAIIHTVSVQATLSREDGYPLLLPSRSPIADALLLGRFAFSTPSQVNVLLLKCHIIAFHPLECCHEKICEEYVYERTRSCA